MMEPKSLYRSKLTTPADAVGRIASGATLSMGMAMTEPPALLKALADRAATSKVDDLKIYYFESALTPNTFWVDFKDVDFSSESGKVMKLDLGPNQSHVYAGNVAKDFAVTKPFRFLGL